MSAFFTCRSREVFALEGGQFQAITYAKPVHYRDAATGAWEEIDNTFTEDVYEGRPCLRNRAGETLAVCASSGPRPFLTLRDASGHSLSYGVEGAAEIFPVSDTVGRTADAPDPGKAAKALALREKVLEKREGAARYTDIFPNVDMVCAVTPGGIKDTVFFGTLESARELTFLFDTRDGEMALDAQKNVIIVTDDAGQTLFTLPMPFLLDAKQNQGIVYVTLSREDGLWRMRCVPDQEFLETAAFPVALDPAVYTQNQSSAIQDTYVRSLYPDANYSSSTENWVTSGATFGTVHSYLKVDTLPSINAANYITKAYLCLSLTSKPSEDTIDANQG